MSVKMKELPISERPYEKLEMYGANTLSNAELLAIIIKSGTKDESSVTLAQKILSLSKSKNCKEDSDFIHSQINMDLVIQEGGAIKIPLNYFVYDNSIINRIIFKCLERIGINSDFERKHIELIKDLAVMGMNGSKIDLPNQVVATKEYEYITLSIRAINASTSEKPFKAGKFKFDNFGIVSVKKTTNLNIEQYKHLIDAKKVPKGSVWRYRKDGDVFEKFGGGKKKLKSYLIDQKIPARLRDHIPVLAFENEILLIAGLEISNKVKIDETTKTAYAIDIYKI